MNMKRTSFTANTQPVSLYKLAGGMAILTVLAGLTDALTSMGVQAQDNRVIQVAEWFRLFQTGRFEAFSRLGVINMLTLSLSLPIYLAFIRAFRQRRPALAALASVLFFVGTAVYLSSNTVFPMFALSRQYAAASAAQKPALEAAGRALLAQGADLTPGTFAGLFISQIAGLLITGGMLRGDVFGKWTGLAGLVGYSLMSVFFILTAFVPAQYNTALLVAAPGALIMMAYQILLARRFFQLGGQSEG